MSCVVLPLNLKLICLTSTTVTGCSSGLGQALAKYVREAGYNVVATARNVASLAYLPDDPKILKLRLDVTSREGISAALDAVVKKFGRLDVLVNNAGLPAMGEAEGFPEDSARTLMETNFWGAATLTRESIPILRDVNPQPGGVIVQVSSLSGTVAFGGAPFYHAR